MYDDLTYLKYTVIEKEIDGTELDNACFVYSTCCEINKLLTQRHCCKGHPRLFIKLCKGVFNTLTSGMPTTRGHS